MNKKPTRLNESERVALMLSANLKPLEPYKSALFPWLCECTQCGEKVSPKYNTIQQGHSGCKACSLKSSGMKRRKTTEEISRVLNEKGLELVSDYDGVDKPIKVKCLLCNSESQITLGAVRIRTNKGCSKCARSTVSSLQVSNSEAIESMRIKGLEPLEDYPGARTPWKNKCLVCAAETLTTRESLRRRSPELRGCIKCAKLAQNEQMITKNSERILARFAKLELELISQYKSANLAVLVRCSRCGYEFETQGTNLTKQKYGCGRCAGNVADPKEAEAFMRAHGFEPLEPYESFTKPWKCLHTECGNIIQVPFATTKRTSGGCKFCAKYGFQHSKSAYLYLIRNLKLNTVKVGIANPSRRSDGDRLKRFIQLDWEVIAKWNFQEGKHAEHVEKAVFKIIRQERGIPIYLSHQDMPIGGHTETMSADSVDISELKALIAEIVRKENISQP